MTRKGRRRNRSRRANADLEAQPDDHEGLDEGASVHLQPVYDNTLRSPFSTKRLDSWRFIK
jgi:hypothetical protein